jgi:hypothetical protein
MMQRYCHRWHASLETCSYERLARYFCGGQAVQASPTGQYGVVIALPAFLRPFLFQEIQCLVDTTKCSIHPSAKGYL